MGKRLRAHLLAALLGAVFATAVWCGASSALAHAAKPPLFQHPVGRGSTGKQVAAAQWILQGHDPNVYRAVIHPLRGHPVTGQYGKRTAAATLAARWLLGEPLKYDKRCRCRPAKRAYFTRELYLLLTGKRARPLGWIGRASTRIAIVKRQHAKQAPTCAQLVVKYARREIGVQEVPLGSNSGPRVRIYQAVTGAYRAAWCVSFASFIYLEAGIGVIADRTANVWYAYHWAYSRGWVRARPVIGAWVAYLHDAGHMGVVIAVNGRTVTSVEGNSGPDRVAVHVYPIGFNHAIYIVPPCARGARA